ncbi:PucR family transcriptional regulator [Rhodococcus tibetensis]|uniref:Helix-turn-helix domain-containing protein n=1 Tax=Rhodococcus tibetensis TaxID=2965064 RepID=A0ABT1QMC8_9NOCA|nr:helix-turn-helix domain-containing protein [Rhodococcus sp. FXJ9.536]MCQ4122803.1 helix-turn-helix domain-containing protein [Rhodococcus sp. FXJ9.536]
MDLEAVPDPRVVDTPRASDLRTVLALTAHMHDCDDRDNIFGLMREALPRLGPFTVEPATGDADGFWRQRLLLDDPSTDTIALMIRAERPPTQGELTSLELLIQHTVTALRSASLALRTDAQEHRLRESSQALSAVSQQLARLQSEEKMRHTFDRLSLAGASEAAIADTLHQLTGLAVGVEDPFGNLRVWAGPGKMPRYRRIGGRNRVDVVRRATMEGRPLRDDNRILRIVRPRQVLLGILYLCDPEHEATDLDVFALDYAATVLAIEMAHERSLAETEARLRRDLGDDLLAGTDDDGAYSRAAALGYDLHDPQRVLVVEWEPKTNADTVSDALRRYFSSVDASALLVHRDDHGAGVVAAIAQSKTDAGSAFRALEKTLGSTSGVLGVGSECASPSEIPQSYSHALRALEIRKQSLSPWGVAHFDELGVYRILDAHATTRDVESFVQEWLGPLLDYDREHHSTMTATLAQYLDCGGKYDETARALRIHRSTLRYRMSRIHELTERDLRSVDTRLNLHLATRALQVLAGEDRL